MLGGSMVTVTHSGTCPGGDPPLSIGPADSVYGSGVAKPPVLYGTLSTVTLPPGQPFTDSIIQGNQSHLAGPGRP